MLWQEVINIKNKNKRKGKRTTVYIWPENLEYAQDLLDKNELSTWVNQQIDKAIMYTTKGIQERMQNTQENIRDLEYNLAQQQQALERAAEIEKKRKERLKEMYKQKTVYPF